MRKVYLFSAVLLFSLLISCKHGTKSITPTSTEFTSGELAKYIAVVEEPAELSLSEQDSGPISSQSITLKVKLELVKDGIKNVDPRDIDFTSLLSVAVINLVDDNGATIQDLNVKEDELFKLKKLLTSEKGTTETIIFEGKYHNSKGAREWYKNTTQFTPHLTADLSLPASASLDDVRPASNSNYDMDDKNAEIEEWLKVVTKRRLTEADIAGLPTEDLCLIRNLIFANHNYRFKESRFLYFFSKYEWYEPLYDNVSRSLNSNEVYNVNFLKSHEY